MKIRKITLTDRDAMLTSFKPLFGDWDYLPLVIDEWIKPSSHMVTYVVDSEDPDLKLIAMGQAYELEPGDWYLRGLRSNPHAHPHQVAIAILSLKNVIKKLLIAKNAKTVRYGTLEYFHESLRFARLVGFNEHFRLAHNCHPIPEIPEGNDDFEIAVPNNPIKLYDYFRQRSTLAPVNRYFFNWWDTRKLKEKHLIQAANRNLLFEAIRKGEMFGAAMVWFVNWQDFLVISIIEGTDEALKALFRKGIEIAHKLGCKSIGMTHPSMKEMNRRQRLFGLSVDGCFTVQLILSNKER